MDYQSWRHAFKLDPAKEISDEALEQLAESGTDGIIIGEQTTSHWKVYSIYSRDLDDTLYR